MNKQAYIFPWNKYMYSKYPLASSNCMLDGITTYLIHLRINYVIVLFIFASDHCDEKTVIVQMK